MTHGRIVVFFARFVGLWVTAWLFGDEAHPGYAEDPYGLSKWEAEQQASAVARHHEAARGAPAHPRPAVRRVDPASRYDVNARHLWN